MHLCNRWGTGEIKIFRGSDYAHIGSVKLLQDADSIGYDPDTQHLYVTNGGGGARLEYATPISFLVFLPRWAKQAFQSLKATISKQNHFSSIQAPFALVAPCPFTVRTWEVMIVL